MHHINWTKEKKQAADLSNDPEMRANCFGCSQPFEREEETSVMYATVTPDFVLQDELLGADLQHIEEAEMVTEQFFQNILDLELEPDPTEQMDSNSPLEWAKELPKNYKEILSDHA